MQETWVQSLGREDPLEKEMVTHSSIFAWGIPWTEVPRGLQSVGLQRVGHDWSDLARTHSMSLGRPRSSKSVGESDTKKKEVWSDL